jgi:hypothetical protein
VEDYLLTNTAGNAGHVSRRARATLRAGFGRHMDDAAVRVLMSVHADYLDTSFAAIANGMVRSRPMPMRCWASARPISPRWSDA